MLTIFNNLKPFFQDAYRELGVREYAALAKVSPPTASSTLKRFQKEGILLSRKERQLLLFRANRESPLYQDLSRAYLRDSLRQLTDFLAGQANYPSIILFGSLAKAEQKSDSDIDIFIDTPTKEINILRFEKELGRKIQLHFKPETRNAQLLANIRSGITLHGEAI